MSTIIDPGSVWQHWRNRRCYVVVCVATETATDCLSVVYRDELTGEHYARPLAEWHDEREGRPRFTRVLRAAYHRDETVLRDCGQDDVCRTPPGCARHWEERVRELLAENVAMKARRETP